MRYKGYFAILSLICYSILVFQNLINLIRSINVIRFLFSICPVLKWLPRYSIKNNLINDVVTGFTVAVLHVPQGMAHVFLAGLDPVVGLYMAFYPALTYFVFGTSRHISTGTYSISSIMLYKIILTYSEEGYGRYEITTAVTMACGIIHVTMYVFRLGILASLLSESLVSGFTTAAGDFCLITE
jgi:solute carrier family 26, other